MSLTTYEHLIQYLEPLPCYVGPILEIGALVGHGTRQLAEAWPDKTIYAVDLFDIEADPTVDCDGHSMTDLYRQELGGRSQRELFEENTAGLNKVRLIVGDSRVIKLPEDEFFLAIIDGGHEPATVESDWNLVKHKAKWVAFHDYGHTLPEITELIDRLTAYCDCDQINGAWLVVKP